MKRLLIFGMPLFLAAALIASGPRPAPRRVAPPVTVVQTQVSCSPAPTVPSAEAAAEAAPGEEVEAHDASEEAPADPERLARTLLARGAEEEALAGLADLLPRLSGPLAAEVAQALRAGFAGASDDVRSLVVLALAADDGFLRGVLTSDRAPCVRRFAAEACRLGPASRAAWLSRLRDAERDPDVRRAMDESLRALGESSSSDNRG